MMFHIQKSYDGVFDTDTERQRIEVAFSKFFVGVGLIRCCIMQWFLEW